MKVEKIHNSNASYNNLAGKKFNKRKVIPPKNTSHEELVNHVNSKGESSIGNLIDEKV